MNVTSFRLQEDPSEKKRAQPIRIGSSVIHPRTGVVEAAGIVARLRRKELDLVTYLYENAARVVTRDELLAKVWNCSMVVTRTVDQTVATLRRKLGDDHRSPRHVVTVHGLGYMLQPGH
jgi:DNA-binding response OmpR family regulator